MSGQTVEPVRRADWITEKLTDLDMVEWDRFTVGEDPEDGQVVTVYGWIERDDEYKDFCLLHFYPDSDESLVGFATSSDEWTHEIHHRLYDDDSEEHKDCRRVEDRFDIPNVVELASDASLDRFTENTDSRGESDE